VRHHVQGLVVFGLAWCITSGSLVTLHSLVPHASPAQEIAVLTAANLIATVLRFVLLRGWVFRTRRAAPARPRRAAPDGKARPATLPTTSTMETTR
jgi:putative flippase GtrA